MAPEYLAQGQLSDKVDVYSFGVLILEIVSGQEFNKVPADDTLDTLVTIVISHQHLVFSPLLLDIVTQSGHLLFLFFRQNYVFDILLLI